MARAGLSARKGWWMRSLFFVCASLFVLSVAASTWLWRELRVERETAAALRAEGSASADHVRVPVVPRTTEAVVIPTLPAAIAVPAPAAGTATTTDAAARRREAASREMEQWMDPEYRRTQLERARDSILRSSREMAQELGLSQGELEQLAEVLAEYQISMRSQTAGMRGDEGPAQVQEILRREQEASALRDAAVVAVLGPARAAQWQQHQQAEGARNQARSINAQLVQAGQPLSEAQVKSLTAMLATEGQRQRQETMALAMSLNPQDPGAMLQAETTFQRLQEESNRRVLDAAASSLSPAQLATVRAQMEKQEELARASLRMQEREAALRSRGQ